MLGSEPPRYKGSGCHSDSEGSTKGKGFTEVKPVDKAEKETETYLALCDLAALEEREASQKSDGQDE
jgi:hypothetical protein